MTPKVIFQYLTIAAIFAFGLQTSGQQTQPPTIKIGVVLAKTGGAYQWAMNAENGINIAVDEINNNGGINGKKIAIVFKDSESNENNIEKIATELIETEKVPVIIGDVISATTLPLMNLANKKKVVLLSPGASSPKLTAPDDYFFRVWHTDDDEGKKLAQYVRNILKIDSIAIFYIDIEYGRGLNKIFKEEFERLGGKFISEQPFPFTPPDNPVSADLTQSVLDKKTQAIFLVGYEKQTIKILRQLKDKNNKAILISAQTFNNPKILLGVPNAAENVIFSAPELPDLTKNQTAKGFFEKYQQKFGTIISDQNPVDCSLEAYDAVKIIAEVIGAIDREKKLVTGGAVREKLANFRKDYQGASGVFSFNEAGDIKRKIIFKQVKNNQFAVLSDDAVPTFNDSNDGEKSGINWDWFWNSQFLPVLIGIMALVITLIPGWILWRFRRVNLWAWKRTRWLYMSFKARYSMTRVNRFKLATLDDYVKILEEQRQYIAKKCKTLKEQFKEDDIKVSIYVLTKQLPRNWPLWGNHDFRDKHDITPLEIYFSQFNTFLKESKKNAYSVDLLRVIIIDSSVSPDGKDRYEELVKDVQSDYFKDYIDNLHNNEDDAFVYLHSRQWPAWLSDAVFYAISSSNSGRDWLWGISTSYDSGEDLIILQIHKLFGWMKKYDRLPFSNTSTLLELAVEMGNIKKIKLSDLKNVKIPERQE